MIILGIDPGTASMGYGFIKLTTKQEPELLDTAVIKTPAKTKMQDRLNTLYKGLHDIVEEFKPDIMVIERLFFNTNVKTAMSVGQARGVPLLVASQHNIDVFEYTALEAKMILTGYGRSGKKEVQEAVKTRMNLIEVIKPDDACDAVAMALTHYYKLIETSA